MDRRDFFRELKTAIDSNNNNREKLFNLIVKNLSTDNYSVNKRKRDSFLSINDWCTQAGTPIKVAIRRQQQHQERPAKTIPNKFQ